MEETVLDKLLAGKKLWNIWAPAPVQMKEMRKVLVQIKKEHQEHLDDDSACHINTGVLLGAMNLVEGLLEGKGVRL